MPFLSIKLKNQVAKLNATIEPKNLKNILVNHDKRGCSGFFYNPANDKYVYVNTEKSCCSTSSAKNLIRYARNNKDYTGETNQYASDSELANAIVRLLTK